MIQIFTTLAVTLRDCAKTSDAGVLGFPTWYKYLKPQLVDGTCVPRITSINDTWLILAAVIEIMLRVAAIAAVVLVIYGGFLYMTSQGEPDKTSRARSTLVNAVIGLAIAVLAATTVSFVAGRIN